MALFEERREREGEEGNVVVVAGLRRTTENFEFFRGSIIKRRHAGLVGPVRLLTAVEGKPFKSQSSSSNLDHPCTGTATVYYHT